jgi:HEAT repeat protein
VRQTLVEGLGRSRIPRAAVPLVRVLVEDGSPVVREAAAGALAMLRETRTIGALFESARYDAYSVPAAMSSDARASDRGKPSGARCYPVREAAAEALRRLGGLQAWEELSASIDDLTVLPAARSGRPCSEVSIVRGDHERQRSEC